MTTDSVKKFYEHNTRRFLSWGGGRKSGVMHREVWGDGVKSKEEAFHFTHQLLLSRLNTLVADPINVLDLGCGVGSSLMYLVRHAERTIKGTGVTISPSQVEKARERSRGLLEGIQCSFIEADFSRLPKLDTFHFVYSIEAFVHAPDAHQYFREVTKVLDPGGKLYLIDDFLTSKKENTYLDRFRAGWRVGSLHSVEQLAEMAASAGLILKESKDLTSYLNLGRPRDLFIKAMLRVPGVHRLSPEYIRSLDGGDALQVCLKNGWLGYKMLGFERLP